MMTKNLPVTWRTNQRVQQLPQNTSSANNFLPTLMITGRCGKLVVSTKDSGSRVQFKPLLGSSGDVLVQDTLLSPYLLHPTVNKWVQAYCWRSLAGKQPMDPRIVFVAILLGTSCYRNWSSLQLPLATTWTCRLQKGLT